MTDIVRDYLKGNPTAPTKQIVADLKTYGISPALAAKVKSRYGKKKASKKPGRAPRTTVPAASTNNTHGTKADALREVAKSMPKPVRPRDVIAVLKEAGVTASSAQVSTVLRGMGMRRRPRRKASAGGAARAVAANSVSINIDDLVAAKKLVGQVGSIEKVKEALTALARLS